MLKLHTLFFDIFSIQFVCVCDMINGTWSSYNVHTHTPKTWLNVNFVVVWLYGKNFFGLSKFSILSLSLSLVVPWAFFLVFMFFFTFNTDVWCLSVVVLSGMKNWKMRKKIFVFHRMKSKIESISCRISVVVVVVVLWICKLLRESQVFVSTNIWTHTQQQQQQ